MRENAFSQPMVVGVLPVLQPSCRPSLNAHVQTVNLIANIFSFLSSNPSHALESVVIYVCHYKLAANVLNHFEASGLGELVKQCLVKKLGPDLYVTADLTLNLRRRIIRSRL